MFGMEGKGEREEEGNGKSLCNVLSLSIFQPFSLTFSSTLPSSPSILTHQVIATSKRLVPCGVQCLGFESSLAPLHYLPREKKNFKNSFSIL